MRDERQLPLDAQGDAMRAGSRRWRAISTPAPFLAALRRNPPRRPTRPRRAACPADRARAGCRAPASASRPLGLWTRLAIVPSSPISTRSVAFSSRRPSIVRPRGRLQRGAADDAHAERRNRLVGGDEGAVVERQPQRPRRQRRIDDDQRVVERALRQLVRRSRRARAAVRRARRAMTRVELGLGVLDRLRARWSRAGCRGTGS